MTVTVSKISPQNNQLSRTQPVVIDVTGTLELATRYVFTRIGNTQVLVHDGVSFQGGFEQFSTVQTLVVNRSYRYSVLPNSGWLASPEVTAEATEREVEIRTPEGSIDFNTGANSYVSTNDTTGDFDQDDAFSVSFWCNRVSLATCKPIAKMMPSGFFTGWYLGPEVANNLFELRLINNFGAGVMFSNQCTQTYDIAGWQHWVATYDGGGNPAGVTWYHQGLPVGGSVLLNGLGAASVLNAANFTVGGWPTAFNQSFRGKLSSPALFDKELSAAEVVELYSGGLYIDYTGLTFEGNLLNWWGMLDNQDAFPVAVDKRYSAHGTAFAGATESSDTPWP